MQPVNPTFEPYSTDRFVDAEITFKLVDIRAAGNASPSVTGKEPVSNLSQLVREDNRARGRWATMEPNLWLLDRTWGFLPESLNQEPMGLWTVLSGPDRQFAANPTLTMTLSAPASSVGFTLHFDELAEQWPAEVRVRAWLSGRQLADQTLPNNVPTMLIHLPLDGYDKVSFEFRKTAWPYRRVRLYSMLFGIVQRFTGESLVEASWTAGCSPTGEALPTRELIFTFDNADRKYNLINPNGLYRYLQDGQEMESALVIGGESVDMGTHYFQKAEAKDGALTAELTGNDRILWLDGETYEEGADGSWTLAAAVAAVLGPDVTLDIPSALGSRLVRKNIPRGTTKREAVRYLAQAARCTCWMRRDGVFVFRELTIGNPVDALDGTNMEAMDGVVVSQPVDKVILRVVNEYYWNSISDEYQTRTTEYTAGTGTHPITINNPCAHDGQAVADWILKVRQRRLEYCCVSRGNPAVEVGDTMTIYNAYDEAGAGVVYGYEAVYDGGLTETIEALGPAWSK